MQHYQSLAEIRLQGAWLTIGSFDGVHRGHQAIVRKLVSGAHALGAPAGVLTFHPHPAVILRNRDGAFYLTTPDERAALLAQAGVNFVITHPFDRQVASLSAREFVERLVASLGLRHLCVGHDFALGRNREGDLSRLQQLGHELGFTLNVMPPVRMGGEVVSSSRIRAALAAGDVLNANALLGRHYRIEGMVVPGDGRGRTIGIPTANLETWPEQLAPQVGVYACLAELDGRLHKAVVNIGMRPTFENAPVLARIEAHLLDFDQSLYQRQLGLRFIARLRDEQRFPNVQSLIEQIQADIRAARRILRLPRQA